jgi:hypothetical protein
MAVAAAAAAAAFPAFAGAAFAAAVDDAFTAGGAAAAGPAVHASSSRPASRQHVSRQSGPNFVCCGSKERSEDQAQAGGYCLALVVLIPLFPADLMSVTAFQGAQTISITADDALQALCSTAAVSTDHQQSQIAGGTCSYWPDPTHTCYEHRSSLFHW